MKAVMVMYDSLNRRMLQPYGCDWVKTPNFQRLSEQSVTFDNCYVGSMPCMPARRELHTGRYNFLHRSWGPLEPFDESMPELLKENGIYSHLVSDHYHYWEDGGGTYHGRYNSWQISRGQEGDPWISDLNTPAIPRPNLDRQTSVTNQDWVNRAYMQQEKDQPQAKTFGMGLEFLEKNHDNDNWFLQMETFDPHEPFFVNDEYKDLYDFDFSQSNNDWPNYGDVDEEGRKDIEHFRYLNAAMISMCDRYLGEVLDAFDKYNLWEDTMLIVCTDHGFLLGEHDQLAKCRMPFYNEIANTPFFVWDPRQGVKGEHRQSLVQTIDIAPTLLDYFKVDLPDHVQGKPLNTVIEKDTPIHEGGALFGVHGGHINWTDGRYIYMRAPVSSEMPLHNYTLMATYMRCRFGLDELREAELHPGFDFSKGCPLLKAPAKNTEWYNAERFGTLLFDLENDQAQEEPLTDEVLEKFCCEQLIAAMKESDAPLELYTRFGL